MALTLFIKYLQWYFVDGTLNILKKWKVSIVSCFRYFAIFVLIKTFFSPWKRITQSYGRGFDIKNYTEAFVMNTMSRIIGAIIRLVFIIIGIVIEIVILIVGFLILIFWIIAPTLFLLGIFGSFYLIIRGYEI